MLGLRQIFFYKKRHSLIKFSVCRAPTLIFNIRFHNCSWRPRTSFKVTPTWLRQIRSCWRIPSNALGKRILLSLPAHHCFLLLLGLCTIALRDDFSLYNHIQASSKIIPGTDYSVFKVSLKSDSMVQDVITFYSFTWYLSVVCHTFHLCQQQQKSFLQFWILHFCNFDCLLWHASRLVSQTLCKEESLVQVHIYTLLSFKSRNNAWSSTNGMF